MSTRLVMIYSNFMMNFEDVDRVLDELIESSDNQKVIRLRTSKSTDKGLLLFGKGIKAERYKQAENKAKLRGYDNLNDYLLNRQKSPHFERKLSINRKLIDKHIDEIVEQIIVKASKEVKEIDKSVIKMTIPKKRAVVVGGRISLNIDGTIIEKAIKNVKGAGYDSLTDYIASEFEKAKK